MSGERFAEEGALTEADENRLIGHIGAWKWESRTLVKCEADFLADVRDLMARAWDEGNHAGGLGEYRWEPIPNPYRVTSPTPDPSP